MNSIVKITVSLLTIVSIISCQRDKLVKEYYESGALKLEYYETPNGKRTGMLKFYYESGAINMTMNYDNNRLNGDFLMYYENGVLKNKTPLTMNNPNGWILNYDSLGNLVSREEAVLVYKDSRFLSVSQFLESDTTNIDKKEGVISNRYYYENGKIVPDSSFFCTIEFRNTDERIKLGDSLIIRIEIPCSPTMGMYKYSGDVLYYVNVSDTQKCDVEHRTKEKGEPSSLAYYCDAVVKPQKKGEGYIFGTIVEKPVDIKEGHSYYFKKKYIVE